MKTYGPWFNIKMSSYQYRKSHCGDKTVVRSSYLHNGSSYTGTWRHLYIESGPWICDRWQPREKTCQYHSYWCSGDASAVLPMHDKPVLHEEGFQLSVLSGSWNDRKYKYTFMFSTNHSIRGRLRKYLLTAHICVTWPIRFDWIHFIVIEHFVVVVVFVAFTRLGHNVELIAKASVFCLKL